MPDPSPVSRQACLTLLLPASAQDRLVDWLLARAEDDVEFSIHDVAARGPLVALSADEERVLGFARRVEVKLIATRARIDALLPDLEAQLAGLPGGYWVLPVERFRAFMPDPARAQEAA